MRLLFHSKPPKKNPVYWFAHGVVECSTAKLLFFSGKTVKSEKWFDPVVIQRAAQSARSSFGGSLNVHDWQLVPHQLYTGQQEAATDQPHKISIVFCGYVILQRCCLP